MIDYSQQVTVYSPESGLRRPGSFFRSFWKDLLASRELAWRLFMRNLQARYRQSILGHLWAFIPPIATTLVWVFLRGSSVLNIDEPKIPYAAFVLTGSLLWQFFLQALNGPLGMVQGARSMLTKINFPREALLLQVLYNNIYNFLIKATLLVIVFVVYKVVPDERILLAPIGIFGLMMFGFAIGLLLMPLSVLYTDVSNLVGAVMPFIFLLTPIIYPVPKTGIAAVVGKYNPISPLINTARDWLTGVTPEFAPEFWIITAISMVVFFLGLILFRLALPHLIARIGS
ncbi:lipopolysaccharide transport system permease protein [Catalinimonas alkaloidigena]|uniref:Transport permease protein n=1 Tax=Catalinimonas alkaloidigena TaxID=1075417 RepID=A0A1G9LFZ7_9BACT|nr:ABC transporter permease [Catalinimonas alkaloidigena]SDL60909.1 lipopolysaccharide transport system permease protein [Catalinimonas alkaloidigena]